MRSSAATGNLLAFSSAVPPRRVSRDFEKVRGFAYVVEDVPRPEPGDDG